MRKRMIAMFVAVVGVLSFVGCSHTPKSEPGKQKVVLVHGYGRSPSAMRSFKEFFENSGYQVYSIGYSSMTQDIEGIKREFYSKVDKHLASVNEPVHFVGHSMGGLLIRSYLGEREVPQLGNVVILGSPNKGTPMVDYFSDKWYFGLAGPAIKSLSSKGSAFLSSLKKPTYNLGVIGGYMTSENYDHLMPGADDGLVPLESTKVEGMKDFLAMHVSHYSMRYSRKVMDRVRHFLINASFGG